MEKNEDGTITTTKIQHIDPIEDVRSGDYGLCQVLQKNTYWKEWQEDGYHYYRQQCMMFEGAKRHAPTNAQGKTFEFVANPKYMASKKNGTMFCGTGRSAVTNQSHTTNVTQWRNKNKMYCGGNYSTQKFLRMMMALKYARKGNSGKIEGCTSYNLEYTAAVGETCVERVIVTKAQGANLLVDSWVCIGARGSTSIRITSIEDVEIDGTVYAGVNVDNGGTTFDTTAGETYIRTMPYGSGHNDTVLGNDGSKTNFTNGKEPGLLQGIEFGIGAYIIVADELMNWVDSRYLEMYICKNPAKASGTAITSDYEKVSMLDCDTLSGWQYIQDTVICPTNFPLAVGGGAGSSNGERAALYVNRSSGVRASWCFNLLFGGGSCGRSARSSSVGVGYASWNGAAGSPSVTR